MNYRSRISTAAPKTQTFPTHYPRIFPRYLVRKPNQYQTGGVTASQTRHGYCPQSLMIRGVLSPSLTGIE